METRLLFLFFLSFLFVSLASKESRFLSTARALDISLIRRIAFHSALSCDISVMIHFNNKHLTRQHPLHLKRLTLSLY